MEATNPSISYRISGHSDARTSRLDGDTYETLADAKAALLRVLPDTMTTEAVDGESPAWLVYASAEAMRADSDGSSAVATIERVAKS